MADEPFNAVDEVTNLATEICAARLDPQTTAADFSALVTLLIEASRSQGYKVGVRIREENLEPARAPQPIEIRTIDREELKDPDAELRKLAKLKVQEQELNNNKPQLDSVSDPPPDRKKRRRTPQEDRIEIRRRHRAATGGGMYRAPSGFNASLCREYGISHQTLYNILREE